GWRIEPPVSVPIDKGAIDAARHAAAPPLEPPGIRSRSHGLRVGWKALFSVEPPIANSSIFVLPISTASAARSLSTTVALYGGTNFSRIREAHDVTSPLVQITSLIATGRPPSGPIVSPRARRSSIARAEASAASAETRKNA